MLLQLKKTFNAKLLWPEIKIITLKIFLLRFIKQQEIILKVSQFINLVNQSYTDNLFLKFDISSF